MDLNVARRLTAVTAAGLLALGSVGLVTPASAADPVTTNLIAVSDTVVDFGVHPFGEPDVTIRYTITALEDIRLIGDGWHQADVPTDRYDVRGEGACAGYEGPFLSPPMSLSAGDVCTVAVTFRPSADLAPGSITAQASTPWIATSVADAEVSTVDVQYYAVNPALMIQPRDVGMSALPGQTTPSQTVTLTNLATVPLDVVQFGGIAAPFAESAACVTPLPVGGSCTASFTFSPPADSQPGSTVRDNAWITLVASGAHGPRTYDNEHIPVLRLTGYIIDTPPPTPTADISLTADARLPDGAVAGAPIEWEYVVQNNGPDASAGTTAWLFFDDANLVLDGPLPGGCALVDVGYIECAVGPLASGQTQALSFTTRITAATPLGTELWSQGLAQGNSESDPDYTNNETFMIVGPTILQLADLNAELIPSTTTPAIGGALNWNLVVSNGGPTPATAATATLTVPNGATVTSLPAACTQAAALVTCTIGDLEVAQVWEGMIALTVDPGVVAGTALEGVWTATSATPDPDTANNTAVSTVTATASTPTPTPTPTPTAPTPPSPGTGSDGELAASGGADASAAIAAAGILLALGGVLVAGAFRRRPHTRS